VVECLLSMYKDLSSISKREKKKSLDIQVELAYDLKLCIMPGTDLVGL
jgi:hypothetical protein